MPDSMTMSALIATAAQPFAALIGVAPLMRRAFANEDMGPLARALLARAEAHPGDAHALLDLSTVLQLTRQRDVALALQAQALAMQTLYALPARRPAPGLRLLALMGPGDLMANTPVEFLLEDGDVALDLLYLTPDAGWPDSVPEHDVMLVAVAESAANAPLLRRLAPLVAGWPRPVLNLPERIAMLSRDGACAVLRGLAGVDMPLTVRAGRADVQALAAGAIGLGALLPGDRFPIIVRPVGSHAGHDLAQIGSGAALADYLARVDAGQFYLSRFVDYRGADGLFRKYRVALIDGRPFICHFAVSSHWMIHYLNAGMGESAEKRAEEAARMADFDAAFAARHAAALAAIHARTGLDYLGIDCAETRGGDLLIFEVDNAMVVHAMDAEELYPYKKPVMRKLFSAFRQLLENARRRA